MTKLLAVLIEIINWLRIALSPTIIGGIVGSVFYYFFQNQIGQILWMMSAISGCVIGIIWASRIWKKQGTTTFMSKIISSPDLDKINMEKDPEDKKTIQQ